MHLARNDLHFSNFRMKYKTAEKVIKNSNCVNDENGIKMKLVIRLMRNWIRNV